MNPLSRARSMMFGSAAILIAVGIVMIYSASAIYANESMGDSAYFLKRHLVYVFAGLALGVFVSSMDLEKYSPSLQAYSDFYAGSYGARSYPAYWSDKQWRASLVPLSRV